MYEIVRGPLVWIAFVVFFCGCLWKIVSMHRLAAKEKGVFPTWDAKYGLRSVAHWVVPFAARNMRLRPAFTLISFGFHICLLVTPLFAMGHAVLWQASWGVSWWSLPAGLADAMTLWVVVACVFFAVRRLASPEVRNVSTWSDYALVALVGAPFLTGFLAHHQVVAGQAMVILHIVTGAAWLIAIPFTRLSHALSIGFTRSYMGSEFGAVRSARDW